MITKHSIDLTRLNEPCFAELRLNMCRVYGDKQDNCRSYKCPFYKPKDCKAWIRIEDRTGVNLIPPEEAYTEEKK